MIINYKCRLEYNGTSFFGWSKQPEKRTVQGEIEAALKTVFYREISVTCAGRTDKGVHAKAQTINFKTETRHPLCKLQDRLNAILPKDISVISVEEVPPDFDARKSAKYKTYLYRIYNKPFRSAIYENYSWHISEKLDIKKMRQAASFLEGKKDFSVFDSYNSIFDYKIVDIKQIKVLQNEEFIDIYVIGDRFLYKMVRKIVAELARIGYNKQKIEILKKAVMEKNKKLLGKPAPPHGLFLMKVEY